MWKVAVLVALVGILAFFLFREERFGGGGHGGGGHGGGGHGGGHGGWGGHGGGGHGGWGGHGGRGWGGRGGWGRGWRGGWGPGWGGSWPGWWYDNSYYLDMPLVDNDPCGCFDMYKAAIDRGMKKTEAADKLKVCLERSNRGLSCSMF